jgi:hypothetical protein
MTLKTKKYHLVAIPKETSQLIEKQLNDDEKTVGKWVNNRLSQMLSIRRKVVFDKYQVKL